MHRIWSIVFLLIMNNGLFGQDSTRITAPPAGTFFLEFRPALYWHIVDIDGKDENLSSYTDFYYDLRAGYYFDRSHYASSYVGISAILPDINGNKEFGLSTISALIGGYIPLKKCPLYMTFTFGIGICKTTLNGKDQLDALMTLQFGTAIKISPTLHALLELDILSSGRGLLNYKFSTEYERGFCSLGVSAGLVRYFTFKRKKEAS